MTFKSNGRKRSTKKLLSSFMCLVISLGFFYFLYRYGFKIGNLTFGIIFAYLSTAFFRTSNEY
jgi:multisubunit Na+/H+ antiporter MnhE subunit